MSERRNQQNIVKKEFNKDAWKPKTELGKKVKSGEVKDLKEILDVS